MKNHYIKIGGYNCVDGFPAVRLVIGIAFLGYASWRDVKTRRVPDNAWIVLGAAALVILEAELIQRGAPWEHQLLLLPTAIIFFAVFFGREMWTEEGFELRPLRLGLYILALVLMAYSIYHFWGTSGEQTDLFWAHLSMPVLLVLAHAFYQFGILRGGADAKAFMSIALLVPAYPSLGAGLPVVQLSQTAQSAMNLTFPFGLVVLLDAALLLVLMPIVLLIFNAFKKDVHGLEALFGYRVGIDKLPKFAWIMDRIENGEHVRVFFPRKRENREAELRKLKERGFDNVWVTPQIPFILPLTLGFLFAFLVGNFLVGLILLFT